MHSSFAIAHPVRTSPLYICKCIYNEDITALQQHTKRQLSPYLFRESIVKLVYPDLDTSGIPDIKQFKLYAVRSHNYDLIKLLSDYTTFTYIHLYEAASTTASVFFLVYTLMDEPVLDDAVLYKAYLSGDTDVIDFVNQHVRLTTKTNYHRLLGAYELGNEQILSSVTASSTILHSVNKNYPLDSSSGIFNIEDILARANNYTALLSIAGCNAIIYFMRYEHYESVYRVIDEVGHLSDYLDILLLVNTAANHNTIDAANIVLSELKHHSLELTQAMWYICLGSNTYLLHALMKLVDPIHLFASMKVHMQDVYLLYRPYPKTSYLKPENWIG